MDWIEIIANVIGIAIICASVAAIIFAAGYLFGLGLKLAGAA